MRLRSHGFRSLIAGTLVVLFLALSFNAHACLVPLFNASGSAMTNGCSTPDEQPVRQFCDTYKTLGVQSTDESTEGIDSQIICAAILDLSTPLLGAASHGGRLSEHPAVGPPRDLLLKTSVLRI
jgi:hypothetical protein